MMVQGRHQENATPSAKAFFGVFEIGDLQDNRKVFDQKDATQQWNHEFFANGDGQNGNDAANGQTACVAHENGCWIGIVPQETH